MLTAQAKNQPVKAVLKVDLVVDGERKEKGDVVQMSHRDFTYGESFDRVAEATDDNVAEVRAQIKAARIDAKSAK